ncbi:MAG: AMP-binding protein [Arenicellales bacterium]|nr:AMP-binding protein [Arenicellales bacterium]
MNLPTLTEGLEAVCREDRRVFYINGTDEKSITFNELYERALGLLSHFFDRGLKRGDELIISTNNNLAFVDAFWACQLGGVIPVPIAPGISEQQCDKLFRIYRLLRNPFVYTDHQSGARLRAFADQVDAGPEYKELKNRTILVENITDLSRLATPWRPDTEDISFIQFSSGSTSDPKGIVLTHRNLTINIADIHVSTQLQDNDLSLSWMPLTHDMGLIGFHLAMLLCGTSHYIMATDTFIRRPTSWLQIASQQKTTLLCSPNFGYRLFLKAFARWKIEELDLSHVRLIFNGAEPVSASVCEEFVSTLEPYGLKRSAMAPVYGLAEATVAVSFPPLDNNYQSIRVKRDSLGLGDPIVESSVENSVEIVAVGEPVKHCAVRITDSEGSLLPDGHVGRIEVSGPNVTQGYYGQVGSDGNVVTTNGWLDTGDLGFIKCGLIYITGRVKDVMFINGQNFYAHDLENIACECPGVEAGRVVVCGETDEKTGMESIIVFVLHYGETDEFQSIASDVRRSIGQKTGAEVKHVIPVDHIPKTTSGKVQRFALQSAYAKGEFADLLVEQDAQPPAEDAQNYSEMEDTLLDICAASLDGVKLERHDNFFEIGMNSLKLVEIHELIDQCFPDQLEVSDLFDHPTLAQLAAFLETKQSTS